MTYPVFMLSFRQPTKGWSPKFAVPKHIKLHTAYINKHRAQVVCMMPRLDRQRHLVREPW